MDIVIHDFKKIDMVLYITKIDLRIKIMNQKIPVFNHSQSFQNKVLKFQSPTINSS